MKPCIVRNLAPCLALVSLTLAACSSNEPAQSPEQVASAQATAASRLDDAALVVSDLRGNILDSVAMGARCVVVVPGLVKAGLLVGGQSGKGFAACQTTTSWSAPAPVSISGGSLGAQIGVQKADVVALLMTDSAKRALEGGNFNVGTDASAAAGPLAKEKTPPELGVRGEVLSYTRTSGLYAGVSLTGATIKPDQDAIVAMYGSPVEMREILEGRVPPPKDPAAQRFTSALVQALPPSGLARR